VSQLAYQLPPNMTTDEFLAWPGDDSGLKYQLVDGEVRPMSPASRVHGAIQANLAWLVIGAARAASRPLQVITEGAIIPALNASMNVRIPDLVVAPSDDMRGDIVATNPILMIEVLFPGNKRDTRENVRAYATLATVREIVVVHSSCVLAEAYRRDEAGAWPPDPEFIGPGGRLRLTTIGLDCPVEEVYAETFLTRAGSVQK
jgi:Uma2 family endonuclease